MTPYRLVRPLAFLLEPEAAHRLAVASLARRPSRRMGATDPRLRVTVAGLDLPNPIGLAAGFDKNAEAFAGALWLGFGFVEVGTVTPQPQTGNQRPRVFRLTRDNAMINRLGFNNAGFDAVEARLKARVGVRHNLSGVVGVNIGANRDSADRVADYATGVRRFARFADYLTINVSSPNTPGLRDLQGGGEIDRLLADVAAARSSTGHAVPIFVKVAPDIETRAELRAIVDAAVLHGIDGLILTNTTTSRDGLSDGRSHEAGGLSGAPLFDRSTALLAEARHLAGDRLALIGVGGIDSAEAAWRKLAAGADAVQLYTGMVYEGPGLPRRIAAGLTARMEKAGVASLDEVVGAETAAWRQRSPFAEAGDQ